MSQRAQQIAIELALAIATVAVYASVFGHDFINLDDDQYVTANPMVAAGLSGEGFVWAFAEFASFNWHPLTWLSHMLDVSLFGMNAGAHHAVNVLFHVLSSVLLLRLLIDMTGQRWPSAVVAAWFALHPAHVESVAWVAERKDVLSTFFLLLTLRAYVAWVRDGEGEAGERSSVGIPVVVWLALGLLSKPMLVTTPFVLLLLDIWPLRRLELDAGFFRVLARRAMEKWALFVLILGSSVVTWFAQATGGAMKAGSVVGLADRIANACVSLARYVGKAFAPLDLALYYPHPGVWPGWTIALSAGIVVGLTVLAAVVARSRPWWIVGWLWFVGTLVPVIGFVQVGAQSMADRYTYIPYIGLLVAVAFGVYEECRKNPAWLRAGGVLAGLSIVVFAWLAWQYVGVWRDSITVFTHSLEVTDPAYPSVLEKGSAASDDGAPRHVGLYTPYYNLGTAYAEKGEWKLAQRHFEAAIVAYPIFPEAYINMGVVLAQQGDLAGSKLYYQRALDIDPSNELARRNLGILMQMMR